MIEKELKDRLATYLVEVIHYDVTHDDAEKILDHILENIMKCPTCGEQREMVCLNSCGT